MEINSNSFAQQQQTQSAQRLSENQQPSEFQQQSVSNILSNYDRNTLSAEQATDIVDQFKDLDIAPSKELAELIADTGFDAQKIAELAGISPPSQTSSQGGRPPPRAELASGQSDYLNLLSDGNLLSQIEELIAVLEDVEASQEQRKQTFNEIREIFDQSNTDGLISIHT